MNNIFKNSTMLIQNRNIVLRVLLILILTKSTLSDLHDRFYYYDLIRSRDIRLRVKRNAHTKLLQTHLSFGAFGQLFKLRLTPGSQVLARDFIMEVVHGNGSQSPVPIDVGDFYHGSLAGDKTSWVSAVHDEGIWTILIFSSVASYYIEPLQIHDPFGPNDSMIAYNAKDVRRLNTTWKDYDDEQTKQTFCRLHHFPGTYVNDPAVDSGVLENESEFLYGERMYPLRYSQSFSRSTADRHMTQTFHEKDHQKLTRERRSLKNHKTCDVIAIADFKAFVGLGGGDANRIAKYLISIYAGVDKIFRDSKFGHFEGIRILLTRMMIFTSDYDKSIVGRHLLHNVNNINEEDLLLNIAKVQYFKYYCVAHVTTQREFKGILGIAMLGDTSKEHWASGICGGTYYGSRNVGLSTVIDLGKKYLALKVGPMQNISNRHLCKR